MARGGDSERGGLNAIALYVIPLPGKWRGGAATGPAMALMNVYHDSEWGVPLHDDRALFEFLILEGAQAGLSWLTILRKREHYRAVLRPLPRAKTERICALARFFPLRAPDAGQP